jgi:acetyl esterase/lipase
VAYLTRFTSVRIGRPGRSGAFVMALALALDLTGCATSGGSVGPPQTQPTSSAALPSASRSDALGAASPSMDSGALPSPFHVFKARACPTADICARIDVARVADIPFTLPVPCRADGTTCALTIDLYYPTQARADGATYPVAVFAKGGPGEPSPSGSSLVTQLAGQGVVVIDASWRQGPAFGAPTWGEGLLDIACAVIAARTLGPEVGGTPGRVTLIGHSLGGWGGSVVALTPGGVQPDSSACLFTKGSSAPEAFAGIAGASYDDATASAESGRAPKIPVLIVHGDADTTQPVAMSQAFAAALVKAGLPTTLLIEPGIDHMGVLDDPATIRALLSLLSR